MRYSLCGMTTLHEGRFRSGLFVALLGGGVSSLGRVASMAAEEKFMTSNARAEWCQYRHLEELRQEWKEMTPGRARIRFVNRVDVIHFEMLSFPSLHTCDDEISARRFQREDNQIKHQW